MPPAGEHMKFIALMLLTVFTVQAVDQAPQWVPDEYKKDFVDFANSCELATAHAKEYVNDLRSPSKVVGCEKKDKGVLFKLSKGSMSVDHYQEFEKVVESCEYSGGTMTIVFTGQDTEGTFMKTLKYTAIIVGSIGLGYLLGGGAGNK